MKLVTCESAAAGHPDKIADQIADNIVDEMLKLDSFGRCGVEVLVNSNIVVVSGEFKTNASLNIPDIVKNVIRNIGYNDDEVGFNSDNITVITTTRNQSVEISEVIENKKKLGASDQGIIFGYASDETDELMPLPMTLAAKLIKRIDEVRKHGIIDYLRPDGKSQVTVEYSENGKPKRVDTVVIAAQHKPGIDIETIRRDVSQIIYTVIPQNLIDVNTKIIINKLGLFTLGGPKIDTGITGRKIISDTYGGVGNIGGGALSGKDPTKLDRSGAYYGRYIAKNIVAAGIAKKCQIQIAYAFGELEAVATHVNTFGTSALSEEEIITLIKTVFPLASYDMIELLNLRRPIYSSTSVYGHFGWNNYPWEQINFVDELKDIARKKFNIIK